MTYSKDALLILEILGDRPVAYHPRMAKSVGGVKQAVFVCQLLYWNGKGKKPDGWIFKTQNEIEEETGLTRREQETVRKTLKGLGILDEELHGVPATLHYRLNAQRLLSSLHEPAKLDCTNPPNLNGASVQSIPESTAENTQETTTEEVAPVVDGTPTVPSDAEIIAKSLLNLSDIPAFKETWAEWYAYRKQKGRKLTDTTIKRQLLFLEKEKADATAILEQSMRNGWLGLFELKSGYAKRVPPALPQETEAELEARREVVRRAQPIDDKELF